MVQQQLQASSSPAPVSAILSVGPHHLLYSTIPSAIRLQSDVPLSLSSWNFFRGTWTKIEKNLILLFSLFFIFNPPYPLSLPRPTNQTLAVLLAPVALSLAVSLQKSFQRGCATDCLFVARRPRLSRREQFHLALSQRSSTRRNWKLYPTVYLGYPRLLSIL